MHRDRFFLIAALAAAGLAAAPLVAQTFNPKVVAAINDVMAQNAAAKKVLDQPLQLLDYNWQGGAPTSLQPAATHFCLLTGFSGKLAGLGERGKLYIDYGASGGPRYMLGGTTQQQFKVTATCVAKSQFVFPGKTPDAVFVQAADSAGCAAKAIGIKSAKGGSPFLSEFSGRFAGAGEAINVTTGFMGVNVMTIAACSGTVSGAALTLGDTDTPLLYRTRTGRTAKEDDATFFHSFGAPNQSGTWTDVFRNTNYVTQGDYAVVPATEAFCGLVGITGKFNGFGEKVGIVTQALYGHDQPWWVFNNNFSDGASSPFVGAAVRCIARDQRPSK